MKSVSVDLRIFLQALMSVDLKPLRVGDYGDWHLAVFHCKGLRSRCLSGPRTSRDYNVMSFQPFNDFCLLR